MSGSAEHEDYNLVNRILDYVEIKAMQRLATGTIRWIDARLDPYDRKAAMIVIGGCRDNAWRIGALGWKLRRAGFDNEFEKWIATCDQTSALLAKGILVPTEIRL